MLRRTRVEDIIQARAEKHPQSAKNELEFLKRVLHDAKGRGQRVDGAIFEIPPVRHRPRRGRGLTVTELYELASWFPEHVSRLVLVAGLVGARQNVWFNLTDEMLDLKQATVTIPAALAKRRREHRIYLTELEASLLREQLMARAAGTSLVFPTVQGKKWTASRFRDRVWVRSIEASVKNDLNKREGEPSIFEGFAFHLLRHTAASLMALPGMDAAAAAERLEHSDGGALFLQRYRHLYEGEKRTQANRLETLVLAALDEEGTVDGEVPPEGRNQADFEDGRYWARRSGTRSVNEVPANGHYANCEECAECVCGDASVMPRARATLGCVPGGRVDGRRKTSGSQSRRRAGCRRKLRGWVGYPSLARRERGKGQGCGVPAGSRRRRWFSTHA